MKAEKRLQIMEAAEQLFTSRRFHEITVDDIAREAGVGKGTIYRYFADKDELFFEVAISGYDALCELIRTETAEAATFAEKLLCMCSAIRTFHRGRRQLFNMMQSEERRLFWHRGKVRETLGDRRLRVLSAVAGVIEEGRSTGQVRTDLSAEALAVLLTGMLWSGAKREPAAGTLDARMIADFFLHGATGTGGEL